MQHQAFSSFAQGSDHGGWMSPSQNTTSSNHTCKPLQEIHRLHRCRPDMFLNVPLHFTECHWSRCPLLRDVILSICMHEYHAVNVNVYISIPGVCEGLDYVWTWERIPKLRQGKATGMHPGEGDAHQPAFERLVANHPATLSSVSFTCHNIEILGSRIKFLSDKPSYVFCYVALWCRLTCSVCGCHHQLTAPAATCHTETVSRDVNGSLVNKANCRIRSPPQSVQNQTSSILPSSGQAFVQAGVDHCLKIILWSCHNLCLDSLAILESSNIRINQSMINECSWSHVSKSTD